MKNLAFPAKNITPAYPNSLAVLVRHSQAACDFNYHLLAVHLLHGKHSKYFWQVLLLCGEHMLLHGDCWMSIIIISLLPASRSVFKCSIFPYSFFQFFLHTENV